MNCSAKDAELSSTADGHRSKGRAVRWFLRGVEVFGLAFASLCISFFALLSRERCDVIMSIFCFIVSVPFIFVPLFFYATSSFLWWCGILNRKYIRFVFFSTAILSGMFYLPLVLVSAYLFASLAPLLPELDKKVLIIIPLVLSPIVCWILSFFFSLIFLLFFKKNERLFLIVHKTLGFLGHTVGIVGFLVLVYFGFLLTSYHIS